MRWCRVAIFFSLTTICAGQESTPSPTPPAESLPDLSLVSLDPTARDDRNIFFDYTVRNNTAEAISPKVITIECLFTKEKEQAFDATATTNEYAGKSGFGGVKPVPAMGMLTGSGHARLVDRSGRNRLERGFRYVHVRVLPAAPASDGTDIPGDVATIDLQNLPADLPPRPGRESEGGWHVSGWFGQLIALFLLASTVAIARGIGGACWLWLPRQFRVGVGILMGGLFGAAAGMGAIWISPFGDHFAFFAPFAAVFFGLVSAVQAGMTASGSKMKLRPSSGDD